ncbi:hypothetical protein ES705_08880 [subsurface metagenome]
MLYVGMFGNSLLVLHLALQINYGGHMGSKWVEGHSGVTYEKLQYFDVAFCDIAENLESALEQFRKINENLEKQKRRMK